MIQYAISNGEGTLIDYGMAKCKGPGWLKTISNTSQSPIGWTVITGPASDDCATGK